jgi:outer membrane protease
MLRRIVNAFALFVSICVGCVFPVVCYSQDSLDFTIARTPYRISLAATAGVLIGRSEEIVYKYADRDDTMSQLLWDLKPMVYAGASLSFSRSDLLSGLGATVDMSVKFGLPLHSGTMEDRDWQNSDPHLVTDFSTHDAYLGGTPLVVDCSAGISFPIRSTVALKALIAVAYMQFFWAGTDGYGEYLSEGWARKDFDGTVITYEQAWLIFSPGIGLFWPLHRALSLDFRFFISPLIYAGDEDVHKKNVSTGRTADTRYNDYMRWGLYLEPSLDITFSPSRGFSLVLQGSFRHIAGTRGDTSINSSALLRKDEAGAGYAAFDVGLSFKFIPPVGRLGKQNST